MIQANNENDDHLFEIYLTFSKRINLLKKNFRKFSLTCFVTYLTKWKKLLFKNKTVWLDC